MGGAPGVTCGANAFCEDFESVSSFTDAPDAKGWHIAAPNCTGTGTLAVATDIAHGGTKSLRIDGKGGYCNHVFLANEKAFAPNTPLHLRYFVRIKQALGDGHVTFLAMKDQGTGKDLRFGGQAKVLIYNREADDATLPELSPQGIALSVAPTVDQWHCVEHAIDGATIQTSVDGADVTGLHAAMPTTKDVDTQWQSQGPYSPALVDLRLGWESYAGADETLYFDDIVVAAAPIGCGP